MATYLSWIKLLSGPLFITETRLSAHFGVISETLASSTDATAKVKIHPEWSVDPLAAGLVGEGCETVSRNRGAQVQVAPMMMLGNGLWAWLSYREEWAPEDPAGRTKRYSFRAASLTVYFGYRNSTFKPQMFRAEWAGFAKWDGTNYRYQAGDAAHPHWQFDALDSFKKDETAERAATFLAVLKSEQGDAVPKEFSPHAVSQYDVEDLISLKALSRMHFASAASWWMNTPLDAHAHAPRSQGDIQVWLSRTLSHLAAEISRL